MESVELLSLELSRLNILELLQCPPNYVPIQRKRETPANDAPVQKKRRRLLNHVPVQRKRGGPANDGPVQRKRMKIAESREIEPTFECFQQLPEEIRLTIWNLTLPGPRLVEISSQAPRYRSTPTVLHVCSESRKEALRSYTAFPLALASNPSKTVRAHVYVNFQIDTLYFNVYSFCKYLGPMSWSISGYAHLIDRLMNNVRSLAIRHETLLGKPEHEYEGILLKRPLFHRFDKLEELVVVDKDYGVGEITDLDVRDEWQIAVISGERDRLEDRLRSEQLIDSFYLRKTAKEKLESKLIKQYGVMKNGGVSKKLEVRIVSVHRSELENCDNSRAEMDGTRINL